MEFQEAAAKADSGDAEAMAEVARMLREGDGTKKDLPRAVSYYRKAIESGNVKAASSLGYMYIVGEGVKSDLAEAERLLSIAVEAGDPGAMCNMGFLYSGKDPARSLECFEKAAEMGESDAQYDLAFMLDSGEGVPVDHEEAEKFFRLAADQGDSDACLCMGGILFERGQYKDAEEYFLTAALKDDVKAEYNIGLLYMGDYLGEPDQAKAVEWFSSAADKGFALAHTMLGTIALDEGKPKEAEKRFRTSAEQGEPTAMYNLGAMGLSNQARMEFQEAVEWLTKAASAGYEPAYEVLMRLNSQQ